MSSSTHFLFVLLNILVHGKIGNSNKWSSEGTNPEGEGSVQ
jgi:hypothetical protein